MGIIRAKALFLDCLPDGDVVLLNGDADFSDFELLRLNKNTGEVKVRRDLGGGFHGLACGPNGSQLAVTATQQNAIWIVDSDSLETVNRCSANQPWSGVFSADGRHLAYIDRADQALVVIDSTTGEEKARVAEVDALFCVASPRGCSFAAYHEGSIVLFDLVRRQQRRWNAQRNITDLAFSADGRRLVSGGDRDLRLWDVATGRLIRKFEGHGHRILQCDISADGRTLVSGDKNEMKLWSMATGQEMLTVPGCAKHARFQAIGRRLLRVHADDRLQLFDVAPP